MGSFSTGDGIGTIATRSGRRDEITGLVVLSISIRPGITTITTGQQQRFDCVALYADGNQAIVTAGVTWGSSDTTIATAEINGVVSAVGSGTVTITAYYDAKTASITLNAGASDGDAQWFYVVPGG